MNHETDRVVSLLREGKCGPSEMEHVKEITRALYPRSDYARDSRTMRRAYTGDQEGRARSVISRRYPKTGWRMPINTHNIVSTTAELGAQVYRQEPARTSGDSVLLDVIESSPLLCASLLETERIAYIVGTSFLLVDVANTFGEDKAEGTAVWPHQVYAIVDEDRPWDLSVARVVVMQLSGEGTDLPALSESFAVWVNDGDGMWSGYHFDGKRLTPASDGMRVLPLIDLRLRPSSSLFAPLARDLLLLQDQVNVTLTDHHHRFALQAHRQLIASGPGDPRGKEQAAGPDTVMTFPDGTVVTSLQENDSTTAVDVVQSMLVLHAHGMRQPIEAWHTKGGNPESGESRKIKNEWSDQKRDEHVRVIVDFERRWSAALSSILVDLAVSSTLSFVDAVFPPPIVYEGESAKTDRVLKLLGAGLITTEHARMALTLPEIDDADAGMVAASGDAMAGIERSEAVTTDAEQVAASPDADVQGTALNGAQVASLLQIIESVASGVISKPTAKLVIGASFPLVGGDVVNAMVDQVIVRSPEPQQEEADPMPLDSGDDGVLS